MPSVTTTAEELATGGALIQNLGTGILYVGTDDTVTAATGFKVTSGRAITVGAGPHFGISDGTSDVRVLPGGLGHHPAA